ncbi:MCE family protein [Saccharopolyspora sp. HNM0986]|uniref:MlaD family protein n=1 Tax=Saccharopolyspora galaxeae TaxID=2781241 RepID=UPI00190DEBAC|nr:MlaD family protein [Saccharopolyspora sp. HNM0986]MBK0870393.1 MCE family protein [Saccharopolyspora sp. HNM0986]
MTKKLSFSRIWERIRTVPGLGRNLLALTVVIVLGVVSSSVILSNQRFLPPWSERYQIAAEFEQVPAVSPDQQPKVRIAGVEVGQVTGSEVTRDGKARLTLSLEPGYEVYRNARLVLRPTNPLNEMYVEINPGGPPAPALPPKGVIPASQTERPRQPDEVLNHLDERSRKAVTNLLSTSDVALANAPQNLPAGLNAADATLLRFKPVLQNLQTRRQNIAELVTALSQISGAVGRNDRRLTELMNASEQTLSVLSEHNADVQSAIAQLPDTTGELKRAMDGVNGLTGQLNPALDNLNAASGRLPEVLRKVNGTVDNLGSTVQAARPVVSAARPVVQDLRPMVDQAHTALGDLQPVARDLGPDSELLVSYLNDLQAFIFNTNGAFSLSDANGGFIRGHVAVPLPDAGVLPGTHGGNTGGD